MKDPRHGGSGESGEQGTAGTQPKPKPKPKVPNVKGLKDDRFGGKTVKPGDTAEVQLKVSETVSHQPGRIPAIVMRGEKPGPTVFVMSAVHGDEINGVAIVRHLIAGLSGRLDRGTLIAVPVANRFGFDANDRYLPDRRDLNRHFPGDARGNMALRIADHLFRKVVAISDCGIDLHTAAAGNSNLCHIRGDASHAPVKELMRATGVPVLVHSEGPKGSLRRAATEAGVPTILFEAGEAARFHRHAVEIGHHAVMQMLSHMGLVGTRFLPPAFQTLVRKSDWVRSDHGGILDLRIDPGDLVARRQEMGSIYDPYGRHVDRVHADRSGVVLGVATDPLIHPGMALVHVGQLDKTLAAAKAYVEAGGDLGYVRWKPPPRQGEEE